MSNPSIAITISADIDAAIPKGKGRININDAVHYGVSRLVEFPAIIGDVMGRRVHRARAMSTSGEWIARQVRINPQDHQKVREISDLTGLSCAILLGVAAEIFIIERRNECSTPPTESCSST